MHVFCPAPCFALCSRGRPLNVRSIRHFVGPLRRAGLPRGIPIYADKGYASAENRAVVRRMGCKSRIMRRAARRKELLKVRAAARRGDEPYDVLD